MLCGLLLYIIIIFLLLLLLYIIIIIVSKRRKGQQQQHAEHTGLLTYRFSAGITAQVTGIIRNRHSERGSIERTTRIWCVQRKCHRKKTALKTTTRIQNSPKENKLRRGNYRFENFGLPNNWTRSSCAMNGLKRSHRGVEKLGKEDLTLSFSFFFFLYFKRLWVTNDYRSDKCGYVEMSVNTFCVLRGNGNEWWLLGLELDKTRLSPSLSLGLNCKCL